MSQSLVRRSVPAALTALAAATLILLGAGPASGSAQAATVTSGQAALNLSGKAGRVAAIRPATVTKRLGKRGARISARVANGSIAQRVTARLAGGIRLASGRGRVNINGLTLLMNSRRAVIRGRVAGRQMNVFNAVGRIAIDPDSGVARLGAARLSFTRAAAATVRRSLKLRRAPLGRIGAAAIQVRVPVTVTDPYLAQCGLAATSKVPGSLPVAPPPGVTGTVESSPDPVTWGFKASFRGYFLGTGGAYAGLDGVTVNTLPFPGPPPTGFTFPASSSEYVPNGAGSRAVINAAGSLVMCHESHGFRITLIEPTVVIDGNESRLIAGVDTNRAGEWTPAQRVVLADLDTSSTEPVVEGTKVTWEDVPVTLTGTGSAALRLCDPTEGGPTTCAYEAGAEMDPITVSLNTTGG